MAYEWPPGEPGLIRYQLEEAKARDSKRADDVVLSFGVIAASSDAVVVRVDNHNKGILEVEIVSTFIPVLVPRMQGDL